MVGSKNEEAQVVEPVSKGNGVGTETRHDTSAMAGGMTSAQSAEDVSLVPAVDPSFEKFGEAWNRLHPILRRKKFITMFITGLSGNGKTKTVEQACADTGREMLRVNITEETDEDDLIGMMGLVDGDQGPVTVFQYGPVVTAMERGAVLLLDEVDLGKRGMMSVDYSKLVPMLVKEIQSLRKRVTDLEGE